MRNLDLTEMENLEGGGCTENVAFSMVGGAFLGFIFGGPGGAIIGLARGGAVAIAKCVVDYDW
ncbi:hypothetical protein U1E44_13745 [Arenibacter sp. GZD96]|uniref:hypothetical protein n=1 Tax=Aurantibrevibacter litoralis TaxID=3106030 RepID=UPI002AFE7FFE|nr:hypothetical protein [Arenibacter sp. GZD-96]MEA1787159.1 hypothetical protein [Arenibacter sp. GZD-96]